MIAKLLISPSIEIRAREIERLLTVEKLSTDHPDVLFFDKDAKLGIEQTKQIRQYLSLRPHSAEGRVVVIINADNLTIEAQNALLKTLEEPPESARFFLGVSSESLLLSTILSRCQLTDLRGRTHATYEVDVEVDKKAIDQLRSLSVEQRFAYIDKLEQKEQFLAALLVYFRDQLGKGDGYLQFTKLLIQARVWQNSNVNLRAILEYLMLNLPAIDQSVKK